VVRGVEGKPLWREQAAIPRLRVGLVRKRFLRPALNGVLVGSGRKLDQRRLGISRSGGQEGAGAGPVARNRAGFSRRLRDP